MTRGRRAAAIALGVVVVAALVVGVVVLADGNGDGDDASTSRTTTTPSGPTTPGSPTANPGTPSTTAPAPGPDDSDDLPEVTDDPQSYAAFAVAAWQAADRDAAREVASGDAVDELFAEPYEPGTRWAFASCGPAAGSLYCSWDGPAGATLTVTVRLPTGGLPVQVTHVQRASG